MKRVLPGSQESLLSPDSVLAPVKKPTAKSRMLIVENPVKPAGVAKLLGDVPASAVDLTSSTPPVLGNPRNIEEAFHTLVSSSSGPGKIRRFTNNVMAWNMVWDLMARAKKTFDFSFFSIEKDPYGYAFLGGLLLKQLQGVQVRGITDWAPNSNGRGFVGFGRGYDYLQELDQYGAEIGVFNPPSKRAKSLLTDGFTHKLISSNHDKAIVIDRGTEDAEGETGGRNIARPYHQTAADNPKSWRDDTVHIVGKVADGLVIGLERELKGPAVKRVKKDMINAVPRAMELIGSYCLMDQWMKMPPLSAEEKAAIRKNPSARSELAYKLVDAAIDQMRKIDGLKADPAVQKLQQQLQKQELNPRQWGLLIKQATDLVNDLDLRGSQPTYQALDGFNDAEIKIIDQTSAASAAPGKRYNEMGADLLHLIKGAEREIVIQNPYVVLTEAMIQAFEDAAREGVKIKIVTNSPESTDSAITQGFFLNDWANVMARVPTMELFVATGKRKFHAKCFAIDGKVCGDTSYNADLLSGLVNGEIGAISLSEASTQELLARIEDDLKDPTNAFKQWSIKRDAEGNAILDAQGRPQEIQGPDQDVSDKLNRRYVPVKLLCKVIKKFEPSLQHPPLEVALQRAKERGAA